MRVEKRIGKLCAGSVVRVTFEAKERVVGPGPTYIFSFLRLNHWHLLAYKQAETYGECIESLSVHYNISVVFLLFYIII